MARLSHHRPTGLRSGSLPKHPRNQRSGSSPSVVPLLILCVLCLGVGFLAGWLVRRTLVDNNKPIVLLRSCPEQQASVSACSQGMLEEATAVFDQPITGEGVIAFTFYGPDSTAVQRKWVTKIPLHQAEAALLGLVPTVPLEPIAPPPPKPGPDPRPEEPTPEAPKPEPSEPTPAPKPEPKVSKTLDQLLTESGGSSSPKGRYTVQLSSHNDRIAAEKHLQLLESKGFDARIEKANIPGKGIWYRVRSGSNLNQERAQALARRLKDGTGLDATILLQE